MTSMQMIKRLSVSGARSVALSLFGLSGFAVSQDGPVVAEGGAAAQPKARASVLWDFAEEGADYEGVVVGDGIVFVLDRAGKINALDAAEGDLLWTTEGKEQLSFSYGLAVAKRPTFTALVVGSDTGLLALDPKTGSVIWRTEIRLGVSGPACTNDRVVAGSPDGHVYGFDLETGKVLWRHNYLEDRAEDPPRFDGEKARFRGRPARPGKATTDGRLVVIPVFDQCRALAYDAGTGERLWDFQTQGWVHATPAIGPRYVILGSQDKHLYVVDKKTGELHWKVKTGARVEGGGTLAASSVYFTSCDAHLYSANLAAGEIDWKFAVDLAEGGGASIYSRPLVVEDVVYIAAMHGKVYAVNRETGVLLWDFRPVVGSDINSDLATDGKRFFLTTRSSDRKHKTVVIAFVVD